MAIFLFPLACRKAVYLGRYIVVAETGVPVDRRRWLKTVSGNIHRPSP